MKHPEAPRHIYAWDLTYKLGLGPAAPLVVCADEDPQKCAWAKIDGSISLKEFESRLGTLPKTQEIVFFCSSAEDASAVGRAAEYQDKGYTHVGILIGGLDAWNAIAGFRPGKR